MEARRDANQAEFRGLKRGWYLGDKQFRKELVARLSKKRRSDYFGNDLPEAEEAKAERIVKEELKKLGWKEKDLALRRKGNSEKVRVARLLRQHTTMTAGWIAKRLQMGVPGHLTHLLYWGKRGQPKKKSGRRYTKVRPRRG
jgi:hypothetical protein